MARSQSPKASLSLPSCKWKKTTKRYDAVPLLIELANQHTFTRTTARLKYTLALVNLLLGSIISVAEYNSCAS
jgi:hypothetical protein